MPPRFELDPDEVERFLKPMEPRAQLIYRLCISGVTVAPSVAPIESSAAA
jgi:hypothetical protein